MADEVNLGALQYQDLSFSPGDLTRLEQPTASVPVIDGYDPFDPEQYKPTEEITVTVKDELTKGFEKMFNLFMIPGKVYNAEKPMTVEELIPQAVDMATTIIGRQLTKGFRARGWDELPRQERNPYRTGKDTLNLGA